MVEGLHFCKSEWNIFQNLFHTGVLLQLSLIHTKLADVCVCLSGGWKYQWTKKTTEL